MNLITPSEVVEYAFSMREQISPASIRTSKIDIAAEKFIRPRIGNDLYDKFTDGEYEPFVNEYIKPALAHYVRYSVIDELSIHLSDNGAVVFQSESSESKQTQTSNMVKEDKTSQTTSDVQKTVQEVNSEKHSDTNIVSESENATTENRTVNENLHTVGEKSETLSETRNTDSSATDKKNTSNESERKTTQTEHADQTKERDFESQQGPQTVGTAEMGTSIDKLKEDTTSTVNVTDSATSIADASNKTTQKVEGTKTVTDNTDSTSDKKNESTGATTSSKDANETRSYNESAEQISNADKTSQANKESVSSGEHSGVNDNSSAAERSYVKPASDLQRRIIRARALADANILMAKAIRYVERNVDIFPEYRPVCRNMERVVF